MKCIARLVFLWLALAPSWGWAQTCTGGNDNNLFALSGTNNATLSSSNPLAAGTYNVQLTAAVANAVNTGACFTVTVTGSASAAATISVNGSSTGTTVTTGAAMTVAVSGGGGPGYSNSAWMAVCNTGTLSNANCDGAGYSWLYVNNCSQTVSGSPASSGTCTLTAPAAAGNYVAAFFPAASNYAALATAPFTAQAVITGGDGCQDPDLSAVAIAGRGLSCVSQFSDDFNGSGTVSSKWQLASLGLAQGACNASRDYSTNAVWQAGGVLHIRATYNATTGAFLTPPLVVTPGWWKYTGAYTSGDYYLEARAQLSYTGGYFIMDDAPGIFSMGAEAGGTPTFWYMPELDVPEANTMTVGEWVFPANNAGGIVFHWQPDTGPTNAWFFDGNWHTVGWSRINGVHTFYWDGVSIGQVPPSVGTFPAGFATSHDAVSFSIESMNCPQRGDGTEEFDVDYVHVYQ